MLELFRIAGTIDLQGASKAESDLDRVDSKGQGLGSKIGGVAKKVGKAGAVIGGAFVAAGAAAGVAMVKYGNVADELLDLSAITGMSTDEMQRWRQVAVDAGVDTNAITNSMQTLNKQLERGNEISPRLAKGFEAMGMSAEEFKNLNPDEQMRNMVNTMLEMEGADRRAFANQMNMADILPMIAELEGQGKDLDEIMNEIDVPFSEDDLNKMNEFRKAWDNFKQKIFEVTGQALLPLFEWFNNNMPLIQQIISTAFEIINTAFSTGAELIQTFIGWLQSLFESNESTFTGIWETIQMVFDQVIEYLQTAWETIKSFWQENGQAILENVMTVFNSIWETVKVVFDAVWQIIQQVIGLVVPFIQEQLARIQQFWEENGEQIMQAVQNAFSIIQGIIEKVMPILTAIIEGAWNIIKSVFNAAVGIVMGIVKTLASLLTGDFQGIKDGLTQIWQSLWDGIKGIVSGAWGLLSGAFSALWSSISGWFDGLKSDAINWGKNMIKGFIDGIAGMAGKVVDAAKSVMDNVKNFLGFNSPAKKGEGRNIVKWGRNMVDGFTDGVDDEQETVARSVHKVIRNVQPVVHDQTTIGRPIANRSSASDESNGTVSNNTDTLLMELIKAVRENKDVFIDGDKVTGKVNQSNAVTNVGRFFTQGGMA